MDHKAWRWRKKSSEKTIFATNRVDNHLQRIEEVLKSSVDDCVGSERSVRTLNEKLASVLLDCHVKEDLATKKYEQTITDVSLSQEKMNKEKTVFLDQELDEAWKKGVVRSESLTNSDAELNECRKQLSIVEEEQEKKIKEAVTMASTESEKAYKKLEEKYAEASKQLANLSAENANMAKAVLVKEKLIEDLNRRKSQAEAEFRALMSRLDSIEKENAFLKYEFNVIERELRIRNEEMEYYRRSADVLQKQYFESMQKITNLEQECQRLRVPARKRLNYPPANTRTEVQAKGRNQIEMRRRKSNPARDLVVRDAATESSPASMSKDMIVMLEKLRVAEEENEALKKVLSMKIPELQFSKPGVDLQIVRRNDVANNKPSVFSDFDVGSDDAISSSGSWASALLSEFERPKNGKYKDFLDRKAADISLMDDFVEMEKLAIVSADKTSGNGQEQDTANGKHFDWLQVVLSAMLEQKHVSKRSLEELLEDIKIALGFIKSPVTHEVYKTSKCWAAKEADSLPFSGYLTWNSPKGSPVMNSSSGATSINASPEDGNQNIQRNLSESIGKIIKLIQNINPSSLAGDHTSEQNQKLASEISVDYFIRVFQWRNSEMNSVLQRFIRTCDDLLNERSNLERFAEEVASALDWILNNYVTPKEGSNARDKIKKHFGLNETERENGESVVAWSEEHSLGWPMLASRENRDANSRCILPEENSRLKDELKRVMSEKADMEARLNFALQESQQRLGRLQAEFDGMKETKGAIEDQIENENLTSDDLDTQLTVARAKLNKVLQKVSSLEVELEDKRNCCEELEATCLELQLQLESDVAKETREKQSQSEWEINTASAKLAECQETIVNLGKQLKAMATLREAAILDKVFTNKDKNLNKRSSLLDRMLDEDGAKVEALSARKVKETLSSQSNGHNSVDSPGTNPSVVSACPSSSYKPGNSACGALAIVPSKKKGSGFDLLRKLLLRRKRRNGQKSRHSTNV